MNKLLFVCCMVGWGMCALLRAEAQNNQGTTYTIDRSADYGNPRKRKDIDKLLTLQWNKNPDIAGVQRVINKLKGDYPHVPDVHWEGMRKNFTLQQYKQLAVALMDHYYTHENIKDLMVFYAPGKEKPRRLTQTMITRGVAYEREYFPLLQKKFEGWLRQRGFKPKPKTAPPPQNPARN